MFNLVLILTFINAAAVNILDIYLCTYVSMCL